MICLSKWKFLFFYSLVFHFQLDAHNLQNNEFNEDLRGELVVPEQKKKKKRKPHLL